MSYQYRFQDEINLEASSRFGDYVGGVIGTLWSLTGVLLFFSSLWTQRREFALQREELSLQRIEMRNQRQEYATMRVIEVMYRQLDLLSKKEEELSLIFPKLQNQSQAHSVTGKLVIQDFTQYVIKRLRPKSLFNPSEYQIELLDILFSYVTSSKTKEHLRYLKQTIDVCIKLIEQQEQNPELESSTYLLDEDIRVNLYLILDGNLVIEQHRTYLKMMKQLLESHSHLIQKDYPRRSDLDMWGEQNQLELIDDLSMKLESIQTILINF